MTFKCVGCGHTTTDPQLDWQTKGGCCNERLFQPVEKENANAK